MVHFHKFYNEHCGKKSHKKRKDKDTYQLKIKFNFLIVYFKAMCGKNVNEQIQCRNWGRTCALYFHTTCVIQLMCTFPLSYHLLDIPTKNVNKWNKHAGEARRPNLCTNAKRGRKWHGKKNKAFSNIFFRRNNQRDKCELFLLGRGTYYLPVLWLRNGVAPRYCFVAAHWSWRVKTRE